MFCNYCLFDLFRTVSANSYGHVWSFALFHCTSTQHLQNMLEKIIITHRKPLYCACTASERLFSITCLVSNKRHNQVHLFLLGGRPIIQPSHPLEEHLFCCDRLTGFNDRIERAQLFILHCFTTVFGGTLLVLSAYSSVICILNQRRKMVIAEFISRVMRKATRSDTSQTIQAQKKARVWTFWI